VPPFKKNTGEGWVTAEYSMLPRATAARNPRDISKLKLSGRSQEIQRLIGRALRSVVNLNLLGEREIIIDCDVIQADGGTRTASITGGFVALVDACKKLVDDGIIEKIPVTDFLKLKAKEEIEREKNEALKEIRNEVVSLALEAASKVLEANMDTEENRKLVNRFIDEQGVA